jgi:5-formyltetrahydrofolate cyclo-ligase
MPPLKLKASLRVEASAIRRNVWLASGDSAREAVAIAGMEAIGSLGGAEIVAGYSPIRDELDVLPLVAALHGAGCRTVLPSTAPGRTLTFRVWEPGVQLKCSKFGVMEPLEEYLELIPDLLLVPLLAFDRKGNRLGYGAGYYDLALRNLRRRGPVTAIGIAFDEQELPEIPREPQDEPLDMILTPSRVIACKD